MSRGPDPQAVARVKDALRDYRHLSKQIVDVRALIAKLEKLEQEAKEAHQKVLQELEAMDVKAPGNMGWEGRVMSFLLELDKQSGGDPIMTIIRYKAPHLFLKFAELIRECRSWLPHNMPAMYQLQSIRESMEGYASKHLQADIRREDCIFYFVDLLRNHDALLALLDPSYAELHKIADACVGFAKAYCNVDLVERVKAAMRLQGPKMRSDEQ